MGFGRIQLVHIDRIGTCNTGGHVDDFVTSVIQAVFGKANRIATTKRCNGNSARAHYRFIPCRVLCRNASKFRRFLHLDGNGSFAGSRILFNFGFQVGGGGCFRRISCGKQQFLRHLVCFCIIVVSVHLEIHIVGNGIELTAVNSIRAGIADFPRRDVFDLPLELQLAHGYLIARLNISATGKIFIRDSADSGCGNGCCVCFRGRPCPKCHSVILVGIGTDAESGGC